MLDVNIELDLNITNLGPISSLSKTLKLGGANKSLIFARNGSGKTFLGRAFRELSGDDTNNINNSRYDLLSYGKSNGCFELGIFNRPNNKNDMLDKLSFNLSNSWATNSDSNSLNINSKVISGKYIYHVFNADYIEDNLDLNKFSLTADRYQGDLPIGKPSKDIVKYEEEKEKNEKKYQTNLDLLNNIRTGILEHVKESCDIKTLKEFSELKDISFDEKALAKKSEDIKEFLIEKDFDYDSNYRNIILHIKNAQEDYDNIKEIKADSIKDVDEIPLLTKLSLSQLSEYIKQNNDFTEVEDQDLMKYIQNEVAFFKKGVELYREGSNKCPFCLNNNDNLISKIRDYQEIFMSRKQKFLDSLSFENEKLQRYIDQIEKVFSLYNKSKADYLKTSRGVDYREEWGLELDLTPLKTSLSDIQNIIDNKSKDLSYIYDLTEDISKIETQLEQYNALIDVCRNKIKKINKYKNDISIEQRNRRRFVVLSIRDFILSSDLFSSLHHINLKVKVLESSMEIEKAKFKEPKSKLAFKTLSTLMDKFFRGKYELSEDFKIILDKTHDMSNGFSEGEKTILAFCYYISDVHNKMNSEGDYKKLFFVIDDPISSLDENYIYTMAHLIRNIKKENILGKSIHHERILILSHNLFFINILRNNGVINKCFDMKNIKGNVDLEEMSNLRFAIPYMSHLNDIENISKGHASVTHTTGNSLRQVVEGIQRFIDPAESSLSDFINYSKVEDKGISFEKTKEVYTISNDTSHSDLFMNASFVELEHISKALIEDINNSILKNQLK